MSLTKSKGNMYDWLSHTWSVLDGKCPHSCTYCYVQAMARRFPTMQSKYTGPIRLNKESLNTRLGANRTIFVEHMNDLFADGVSDNDIMAVLEQCKWWPKSTYVFQSKNVGRMRKFVSFMPPSVILGTTIESDRHYPEIMGTAPEPEARRVQMEILRKEHPDMQLFVTIEPILDCRPDVFAAGLAKIKPTFVNIGADSKGHGLLEPSADTVNELIAALSRNGITVRKKHNLARLLK